MAVSQIEEKILGRLAKQTEQSNALLSASLYQVLGLSILLSRKLYRARRLRRLDNTRDTKSLQLYHHIIWLAREGLSITEVYILPYCQDGQQGPECRVMAAKLRASLYHVFCLFHNHPPLSQLSGRSNDSPTSSTHTTPKGANGAKSPSRRSPQYAREGSKRAGKAALRDPIPSMTSDASYVTNPYATGSIQTPPPPPGLAITTDPRKTPTRPPGLAPINIPATRAAASFLLPPLNFVPMARDHFESAQHLANSLLSTTHALRLSIALESAAFLWDCAKEHESARRLARRTIKEVYSSTDGLDDDEFADASLLVQALGGIVRRGSEDSTPRPPSATHQSTIPAQYTVRNAPTQPMIDRTISLSPADRRNQTLSPRQQYPHHQPQIPRSIMRTPERLSTVPEVESHEESLGGLARAATTTTSNTVLSPPISRLSSRSRSQQRRTSSVTSQASDKASKRRIVEAAEERAMSRQGSTASRPHSRQPTPTEGISTPNHRLPKQLHGQASASASIPTSKSSSPRGETRPRQRCSSKSPSIKSSNSSRSSRSSRGHKSRSSPSRKTKASPPSQSQRRSSSRSPSNKGSHGGSSSGAGGSKQRAVTAATTISSSPPMSSQFYGWTAATTSPSTPPYQYPRAPGYTAAQMAATTTRTRTVTNAPSPTKHTPPSNSSDLRQTTSISRAKSKSKTKSKSPSPVRHRRRSSPPSSSSSSSSTRGKATKRKHSPSRRQEQEQEREQAAAPTDARRPPASSSVQPDPSPRQQAKNTHGRETQMPAPTPPVPMDERRDAILRTLNILSVVGRKVVQRPSSKQNSSHRTSLGSRFRLF